MYSWRWKQTVLSCLMILLQWQSLSDSSEIKKLTWKTLDNFQVFRGNNLEAFSKLRHSQLHYNLSMIYWIFILNYPWTSSHMLWKHMGGENLTLLLEAHGCSTPHPRSCYPVGKAPGTHRAGYWVGSKCNRKVLRCEESFTFKVKVKVKLSHYRPRVAQRVPES